MFLKSLGIRAFLLNALLLSVCVNAQNKPFCPDGSGYFVLDYAGKSHLNDFKRIADSRPNFVVLDKSLKESVDVLQLFHEKKIRVIIYVAFTEHKDGLSCMVVRPTKKIDDDVRHIMSKGFDGIFFDCAWNHFSDDKKKYNKKLWKETNGDIHAWNSSRVSLVKSEGAKYDANNMNAAFVRDHNRLVIMNPGSHEVESKMFSYADIVSVENDWNFDVTVLNGETGNPPAIWRWLAVQGDPSENAASDSADAFRRMTQFRDVSRGFWYYSPPFKSGRGATHDQLFDNTNFMNFAELAKKTSAPCSE